MKLPVTMVFISVVILFLLMYMFIRFIKRRNYILMGIFVLQVFVFSMVISTVIDNTYTTWWVELIYIICGIVLPITVLIADYVTLVRRLKKNQAYNGFIEKIPYRRSTRVDIDSFTSEFGSICSIILPEQLINYVLMSDKHIAVNVSNMLKKANASYMIDQYEKASTKYQFLSNLFSENPYVQYNFANIKYQLGEYKSSVELYRLALRNDLSIEDIRIEDEDISCSVLVEEEHDNDDTSIIDRTEYIDKLSKKRKKKDRALQVSFSAQTFEYMIRYNLALSYQKYGQHESAFRQLRRILKKQTGFANTEQNFAKLCVLFDHHKHGIKYLKKVAELNGYNVQLLFVLGRLNYDIGSYEESISFLMKGLELESDNPDILALLSKAYRKAGNNELSVEYGLRLLQATEPNEEEEKVYYSMGKAYFKLNLLEDAEKCYHKALERSPDRWEILYDLGVVQDAKGDYVSALKTFEAVVKIKNDFPDAYNQLIIILAGRKRLREAINVFKLAVKYCPKAYTLHFNIGNVLMQLNRVTEAIEAYKNALSIEKNDLDVYLYLSSAYIAKHKYDKAIEVYKKGLKGNEKDSEIYFGLARVYGLMNEKETSLEMLRRAISYDASIKSRARNLTDFIKLWDTEEFNSVVNQ